MVSWLERAAILHPERVAVDTPERSLTYRELEAAARSGAGELLGERGPVAIALPPGAHWLVALHACLLASRPLQPVDLRLGAGEREVRRRGATHAIDAPLASGHPAEDLTTVPGGDDVAAVLHTSGTTAEPRQVHLTHGNFLASALGSAAMLGLDPAERWLCPMPLTHVGGLSIPIRSVIYATTAVLHGGFDTETVLEELMNPERGITLVSLVPTMLSRLLDAGLERPPTLRWALLGGGPIPPRLLSRAWEAGVPVAPSYGMTEACSQIATFGVALPGVEIALREEEILVRGPIVSPGALAPDGWLHTGDLGRLDERGRLGIVGRAGDTIVTGGENVAPAEVEAVLLEHPAVADAGVFARPDPEWGEALCARIVLRSGSAVTAEELRVFCRERLAGFKVPKSFELAESLPRTASGKLLRRELSSASLSRARAC